MGYRGKQDTAQLTQFQTYKFFKGKIEIMKFLTSRTSPCGNERAVRRSWRKNIAGR